MKFECTVEELKELLQKNVEFTTRFDAEGITITNHNKMDD